MTRDYSKEIKKLNRELYRIATLMYSYSKYEVKSYTKKQLEQESINKLIQRTQGQSRQLKRQQDIILKLRWKIRELLIEKRKLLKELQKQ